MGPSIDSFATTANTQVLSGTSVVLGAFWQASPFLTLALVAPPDQTVDMLVTTARVGLTVPF